MALEEKLYQYLDRLKVRYPLVAFIVDVIEVYLDRRVSRSSAELAYYLLLSVFPMLIMVISALGWLHLDANSVISFLKTILPAQIMDLFSDYISYVFTHQSSGLFLAGLIMSITASSAGFRSLMSISAEIYGRRTFRGVWYLLTSLIFSVLLLVMVFWVLRINRLTLTATYPVLAVSRGVQVNLLDALFNCAIAVVVTLSLTWVGLLVINSLLVLPGAAARNVAKNMRQYTWLALLGAVVSGIAGLMLSFYVGSSTGASITLCLAVFFAVTYCFRHRK